MRTPSLGTVIEFEIFRGIGPVQAAAQDRQGAPAGFQGLLVGGGVDAPGQSAHHRHSPGRQAPGQAPAGLQTVVGGAPGAHHRRAWSSRGRRVPLRKKKTRGLRIC